MDEKELNRTFSELGMEYGYSQVKAEYSAFRDFKVKWVRGYKWVDFQVSDYLNDAPDIIISELAHTIFGKIRGDDVQYPQSMREWLSSREFLVSKQPIYLKRYVGLSKSPQGNHHDLSESYARLIGSGLVAEDTDVYLGWLRPNESHSVGRASTLMKVVAVSPFLDDPSIDDTLLDFCLYAQLAQISLGYDPSKKNRGQEYDVLLNRFPDRRGMEAGLRRLGMHI